MSAGWLIGGGVVLLAAGLWITFFINPREEDTRDADRRQDDTD